MLSAFLKVKRKIQPYYSHWQTDGNTLTAKLLKIVLSKGFVELIGHVKFQIKCQCCKVLGLRHVSFLQLRMYTTPRIYIHIYICVCIHHTKILCKSFLKMPKPTKQVSNLINCGLNMGINKFSISIKLQSRQIPSLFFLSSFSNPTERFIFPWIHRRPV